MVSHLGIYASQISGHLTPPYTTTGFNSISTVTVGVGGTPSITFSSIPASWKHLQIRGIGKTDRATYIQDGINVRFNSDTGSNYSRHAIWGSGSTPSSDNDTSQTLISVGMGAAGGGGSSMFSGLVLDIQDAFSISKYKTLRALSGTSDNGSVTAGTRIYFSSGLWMSTSAISSITLTPQVGSNFTQYTSYALYGIEG